MKVNSIYNSNFLWIYKLKWILLKINLQKNKSETHKFFNSIQNRINKDIEIIGSIFVTINIFSTISSRLM